MPPQPNTEPKLPTELLALIFELVSPKVLAASIRCSKLFYEICNPLLYREIHLHKPAQLVALSESQKATHMLGITDILVVDDLILYLEAWDGAHAGVEDFPRPLWYLLRVLTATTSLHSLKIINSHTPDIFYQRADWSEKLDHPSELLRTASDPEFLPNLKLISVFNPSREEKSWFEALCYDRVVECYSIWNGTSLYVKIFPALERSDAMTLGPQLSPLATSQLASYANGDLSGRDVGRLTRQSLDLNGPSTITHLGLLVQFPDTVLHDKPSHIHNSFTWIKDVISIAGCPRLEGIHVRFKSLPSDWAADLDAQRQGLEELQKIAPTLIAAGMSSTRIFWRRWIPMPGKTPSYPAIPFWTPCPAIDPGTLVNARAILVWWLSALGFNVSAIQDRKIMRDLAKQLSAAMRERWDFIAPTEAALHGWLLSHF